MAMAMATASSSHPRPLPSLTPLTSQQLGLVLPWSGSGYRVSHEFGNPMDWVFRLSASLASTFCVFRHSYTVAALASLFWLWGPMWFAALRSCQLRLRFPHAGVWQARVLAVGPTAQTLSRPSGTPGQDFFGNLSTSSSLFFLEIGDDSSARIQIDVPSSKQIAMLRVGELAELLVLSDRIDLSRFKAVRDIYFPRIGMWISQDPWLEKTKFETVSKSMSSECAYQDARQYSYKKGASYLASIPSEVKKPLIDAVNTQNIWLLSKEPRQLNMSYELDWDNSEEREGEQHSNHYKRWHMRNDE